MTLEVQNPAWRKSSHSGGTNGDCVELARGIRANAVRDSKNPNGGFLTFGPTVFTQLLSDLKLGKFDR